MAKPEEDDHVESDYDVELSSVKAAANNQAVVDVEEEGISSVCINTPM